MKQELVLKKNFPEGWKWSILGEIATYYNGRGFKSGEWSKEGLPIIRIQNLTKTTDHYNYYNGPYDKNYHVKNGDLLLAWSATLDIFVWDSSDALLNQHIFKIEVDNSKIEKKYFFYYIKQIIEKIKQQIHVLPQIKDQKIRVTKLDKQMKEIEMMKKASNTLKEYLEESLYSFVESIFENKFEEMKLDELIDFVKSGISRKFETTNVGVPVMRSTNIKIKTSSINLDDIRYWYWDDTKGDDTKKYLLDQGDILLNFINSPAQIGKVCIYRSEFKDCIYTTNSFRIKFDQRKLLHKFFRIFSLSKYYRKQIEATTKRAVNQASFTQKDLRNIKIPLPSVELQENYIFKFELIETELQNIIKSFQISSEAILLLQSSILNEVFGKYEIPEEA